MFPKEFPGWKPIPRGMMSVGQGFTISGSFYRLEPRRGRLPGAAVGWIAVAIAAPGILLGYFYAAPPLRLDYRGFALGEAAIFLSFGAIPSLGAFFVLTGGLSVLPLFVSIPSGLLTTNVVLTHDMIFYDSYKAAGKRSLTVVIGRVRTERLTFVLAGVAYAVTLLLVAARADPRHFHPSPPRSPGPLVQGTALRRREASPRVRQDDHARLRALHPLLGAPRGRTDPLGTGGAP